MLSTKPSAPAGVFSSDEVVEPATLLKRAGWLSRFHWEDALWVLIVGALTSLWVMLLMSPAWR